MKHRINTLIHSLGKLYRHVERKRLLSSYVKHGRKPWSEGYSLYKEEFIRSSLNDANLMRLFREGKPLPGEYGKYLDERVVEYPWLFSRLSDIEGKALDAGSTLNYAYLLSLLQKRSKEITISTLEPETNCFWAQRISYVYCDLREIPFKNDWFDELISISVIEHMGMDNSLYTSNAKYIERNPMDYLKAIEEFRRVTKPDGKLFITVPFGRYIDYGWYQQFDAGMIDRIIDTLHPSRVTETYYCYENNGWTVCSREHCHESVGFDIHDTKYFNPESKKDYDPDLAASSRAIAALEFIK